jgi:hypothetical protein
MWESTPPLALAALDSYLEIFARHQLAHFRLLFFGLPCKPFPDDETCRQNDGRDLIDLFQVLR